MHMNILGITWRGESIDDVELLNELPSDLVRVLEDTNGFIVHNGAFHVRGASLTPEWHSFILQTACDLPEGVEVELFVQSSQVVPPKIADLSARQNFLNLLVERMQQSPIPLAAPRFTRDMLHERR